MVELLTVIAIIATLAAITFPVYARVRENSYRSSDLTAMNSIRTALQLYRVDQGAYPPALLGYATGYSNLIPNAADIVPANQVVGALYPKRVDSLETLRPALVRPGSGALEREFTRAVWPNRIGNGAGASGQPNQRFGPADGFVQRAVRDGTGCVVADAYFYRLSGFDAAEVRTDGGRVELRYTLFWTGWTVPQDPCNPNPATESGSANDDPRQLGYTDPPETTVITWNSFFRDYEGNQPSRTKKDYVVFLGGSARTVDSRAVSDSSYQIKP